MKENSFIKLQNKCTLSLTMQYETGCTLIDIIICLDVAIKLHLIFIELSSLSERLNDSLKYVYTSF